jgi:hypothetical protein
MTDPAVAKSPRKRAPEFKHWETRRISMPAPVWIELNRRLPGGERHRGCDTTWRQLHAISMAVVNYLQISDVETYRRVDENYHSWLEPRWLAMQTAFAEGGQEAAAKALSADPTTFPQGSRIGSGTEPDEVARLASRLRQMSGFDAHNFARAMNTFLDRSGPDGIRENSCRFPVFMPKEPEAGNAASEPENPVTFVFASYTDPNGGGAA